MIKLVIFDFDGVFTDGKFYFDNSTNITKSYNAKDAYSLKLLKKENIKCGIITNDKIVSIKNASHIFDRLDKVSLGSDKPKINILNTWMDEFNLKYEDVAYIGDDLPDIPVLKEVGFSACPNDAVEEVKKVSQYVCKNKGGECAVREFVDLIISNNMILCYEKIRKSYKYLITGGYGFLGINFIYYLLNNGVSKNDIIIIDNLSSSNININNYSFLNKISFIKGDIGNEFFMNNLKFKVDVIFHFAAQSGGEGSFDDTIYDSNTNSKGTLLLLNYARKIRCNKFIFTSTCAVYGGLNDNKICYSEEDVNDPNTFYAINKLSSEKYLKLYNKNYGINYTIFRLFNCYGPFQNLNNMKQGMVSIFLKQILSDKYPKIIVKGSLDRVRDLIYVEDVVKIILDSANNSKFDNDIFNLGTGVPNTVKTILENLMKNSKQKNILIEGETPGDMDKLYANNSKLKAIYSNNFEFTTHEIGIKKMCEHYLYNYNINKIKQDGKITAVIPVRKGSTRCKKKNMRDFGDTNLLKLKIETLKKVKGIDKILVSSNCDIMLQTAKDMGVDIHKRDEKYCTSTCSGSDLYIALANAIDTEILLMTFCVTPFVSLETYTKCISKYRLENCDSLSTVYNFKHYLWHNNEPINYDYNNAPPTQNLPDYFVPSFGIHLTDKDSILKNKNVIGKNPFFEIVDQVESIDIDTSYEYLISELLYNNNIFSSEICEFILNHRTSYKNIKLLDCTIRDGGYLNNWEFSDEEVLDCYKAVTEAGYEYFEIGFRTNRKLLENKGKWCYSTEEDINNIYKKYNGCKIVIMAKIGTVTIDDFIKKDKTNVTMVRVLLARATQENEMQKSYYNKLDIIKAKTLCQQLIDYGYEVCMNFCCGDIINDDEIKIIASEFHNVKINALYLADTYGGFNTKNLPIQLHKFYAEFNKYNSDVSFGFHCHNNNEDAFSKTTTAIYHGCTMIDSCIGGLGRGAGNLKSEQLMSYLYTDKTEYIKRITPLIVYFDKHILSKKEYQKNHHINSHPYYMISGVLSLHPNYILEILNMDTNVINDIELIVKLDKYTREINKRNYDKKLINKLSN